MTVTTARNVRRACPRPKSSSPTGFWSRVSAIRPGANIPMKMKPPTPIPPTQATIRHRREGRCPSGNNRNGNASARNAPAPHTQLLTHCAQTFVDPLSTVTTSPPSAKHAPDARSSQPIGFSRRRDATRAPTVENASRKAIVAIVGACPPGPPSDDGLTTPATVPRTTHRMQSDQTPQASRAAVRPVMRPPRHAMAGFWPVGPLRRKGTTLPAPRTELPLPCGAGTPHEPWWRPGRPQVVSRRTFASTTNGGTRWAPSW